MHQLFGLGSQHYESDMIYATKYLIVAVIQLEAKILKIGLLLGFFIEECQNKVFSLPGKNNKRLVQ